MGDCIVDACVIAGASDTSVHIDAIKCFNVINALYMHNHMLVCNAELFDEWSRHLSRYSSQWLASMASASRIVYGEATALHTNEIENVINNFDPVARDVASKDKHILALAVTLNALVISSETRCRAHYVNVGRAYAPVSGIHWVSPLLEEDLVPWIQSLHVHGPPPKWLLV